MHVMMPYMFGDRTNNEAVMGEVIDLTEVDKYLAVKNAGNPDFKYTWFHVITAAIAAMMGTSANGFVVRHVKRVHNAPAFSRAGREAQMNARF